MQIIVNELLVNYESVGEGPALLWLHGWASSSAAFRSLAASLPGYRHILLDLPGFGGSQIPEGAWSLQDYASFLKAFLSKTAIKPVVVAGHSYGAAVAIVATAEQQIKPKKLILLGAAGIRNTDAQNMRRSAFKVLAKLGKVLVAPLPAHLQLRLRRRLYAAAGSDMLVNEAMTATFKRSTAQDVLAVARLLGCPTLLIYGEQDTETPVHFGELFTKAIPRSRLVTLSGAGHFVFIDQQASVASELQEFLAASTEKLYTKA